MSRKQPVLVIVGPTATGKTALSVALAEALNGEIISGDSLQIYRGLDIGTAKVTEEEMKGIPHYLINERDSHESYSVAEFQKAARARITDIQQRGKLPIVAGGTGLYIQALLFDFTLGQGELAEEASQEKRQELRAYQKEFGSEQLWQRLNRQDPVAAGDIHQNNLHRVMRALEVVELTGEKMSEQVKPDYQDLSKALYDVKLIGLEMERSVLYERINQRVDLMVDAGLVAEAEMVYQLGEVQGAQGIGYKEFFPYFKEEISLAEAIEQVKQNSRRYAKRQLTWFRNRMSIQWLDALSVSERLPEIINEVNSWLSQRKERI